MINNRPAYAINIKKRTDIKRYTRCFIIPTGICLLSGIFSCKKFITIDPPKTQIIRSVVFSDDKTATAAIAGIYSKMTESDGYASGSQTSITLLAGLSADEFVSASSSKLPFYSNDLLPNNTDIKNAIWAQAYASIYYANAILDGLAKPNNVSVTLGKQLAGEAKFIRAFCHFYLFNLFGDIPVVLSSDYRLNNMASRLPAAQVYSQIIKDLIDAQQSLAADYSIADGERVRPNKWAATALLARVYLYTNSWPNAETQATAILSQHSTYSLVDDLTGVFKKNSTEAIWQLMPVVPGYNTWEGRTFPIQGFVTLSNSLLSAFEVMDNRKSKWLNSYNGANGLVYYPFKYQVSAAGEPVTEYSMVLRLAEQYLIRSEARTQQGNISGALDDLNTIRLRAGLPMVLSGDKATLLSAIAHERQVEMFSEWGHRWFDLKRTNRADTILGPLKRPTWQSTDVLYPIPQSEINVDANLTQNAGY